MQLALQLEDERVEGPVTVDPHSYDHVIVGFSGGKDSVAAVLSLIDMGIRPELWHHHVDGEPGHDRPLYDWPVTASYVEAFAKAFDLTLMNSWRNGGLRRELYKTGDRTAPVTYETPEGRRSSGGINGKISTRRRFAAQSPDLRVRWCSSVAKIDVCSAALAGQDRFKGKRTLFITGERAQESASRSRYATFERHRTHAPGKIARRHVDHWRPIHGWTEEQVWTIIERHRVVTHPCYHIGFSRASCMLCIFLNKHGLATIQKIAPERFGEMAGIEKEFGCTVKHNVTLTDHASLGTPYDAKDEHVRLALSERYEGEIITDRWELPAGAYGEGNGPS